MKTTKNTAQTRALGPAIALTVLAIAVASFGYGWHRVVSAQHSAEGTPGPITVDGILIGDGRLNYQEEKILEAYYALNLGKGATLTFDYQFVVDPAYNADRGPVSIFATRMHVEF